MSYILWGDENVSVEHNALERICITKSRLKKITTETVVHILHYGALALRVG